MRTYSQLFAIAEFRVLFLTQCLSVASLSIASLALGTITYAETGSTVLTALSIFGGPLITLVGSATLLGASDRLRPRTALLMMAAASLLAYALQAVPGMPWQTRFLILAIPYVVLAATGGAMLRLLSEIVGEKGFVLGRATLNVAVGVFQIVGFTAGGVLLVVFSAGQLFTIAAGVNLVLAVTIALGVGNYPGIRSEEGLIKQTRAVNRQLLASPVTRPIYLCLWVPNGLIVGCEALFVPFTEHAGLLFAAMAAGMLVGDVGIGRFASPELRDRLLEPMRVILAAPWLLMFLGPPMPVVLVIAFCSAAGYASSLPLQDRLLRVTGEQIRGQTFGLAMNGMKIGHACGAFLGGLLATWVSTTTAMGLLGVASLAATVATVKGLQRSSPRTPTTSASVPHLEPEPVR